jgi:hypothetical protein
MMIDVFAIDLMQVLTTTLPTETVSKLKDAVELAKIANDEKAWLDGNKLNKIRMQHSKFFYQNGGRIR